MKTAQLICTYSDLPLHVSLATATGSQGPNL
jgi:hypothetical protein